jgi:hypothetical protein
MTPYSIKPVQKKTMQVGEFICYEDVIYLVITAINFLAKLDPSQ